MTTPEVFASVGINTILAKVTEIEKTLAVMACDLSALRKTSTEDIEDLDVRVRAVEADRWPWMKIGGLVAVAALIASVVFGLISIDDSPPPRPPQRSGTP